MPKIILSHKLKKEKELKAKLIPQLTKLKECKSNVEKLKKDVKNAYYVHGTNTQYIFSLRDYPKFKKRNDLIKQRDNIDNVIVSTSFPNRYSHGNLFAPQETTISIKTDDSYIKNKLKNEFDLQIKQLQDEIKKENKHYQHIFDDERVLYENRLNTALKHYKCLQKQYNKSYELIMQKIKLIK
tara:strand:- start:402 stop:950 length:549 start_codon:yes stop_codon:yes gene_type:complete